MMTTGLTVLIVSPSRRRLDTLAPREREVALAVGRGASNAEIAAELHLSVATVKAHVSRVLARLGLAPDTAEAQVVALVRVAREAARALYDDKNEVFDPIRLELALAPFAGLEEGEP